MLIPRVVLACLAVALGCLEAAATAAPFRVVALGDSITLGARPARGDYPAVARGETFVAIIEHRLASEGYEADVINAGVPSNRTDQGVTRLDSDVLAHDPDAVLIMFGTNDSCHDPGESGPRLPLEEYEANLRRIVLRIRDAGAVPILMTPPALGTMWSVERHPVYAEEGRNAPLIIYSEAVRRVAGEERVPLVDHFRKWHDMGDPERDSLLPDGCHPNGEGHDVLAGSIHPVLHAVAAERTGRNGPFTGLTFTKIPGPEPGGAVFSTGGEGAFDAAKVAMPYVLERDGLHRMWYSAGFTADDGAGGIGLATSTDGITWKRRSEGEPVLTPGGEGAFDELHVMGPAVHFDGELYRMWYTGQSARRHESGIVHYAIGLAESVDGVTWERRNGGAAVIGNGPPGSHDSVQAATPAVLHEGGGWRMWYAAWSPEHNHTICTARSADGVVWEKEGPVGGLAPPIAYGHSLARLGDQYIMLYMALQATRGLYGAISSDGRDWVMLNSTLPLLEPEAGGFDASIVGHPALHRDGKSLRAWYTGYESHPGGFANWRLSIGLATAELRGE